MKVRETIRKRIKDLQKTAREAAEKQDKKTFLNCVLRADECKTILKML